MLFEIKTIIIRYFLFRGEGGDQMKVLFYSGSVGLGHVNRDIAIANELRKARKDAEIVWAAGDPALSRLKEAGEFVIPSSEGFVKETDVIDDIAKGFEVDLYSYCVQWSKNWKGNYLRFLKIADETKPDLIIGDEAYEVISGFAKWPDQKHWPFVNIFDFAMFQPITGSFRERLICFLSNRYWNRGFDVPECSDLTLYLGDKEEIPDVKYGPGLHNVRQATWARWKFVGEAIHFDPNEFQDKDRVRKELGYTQDEVLIIGAAGGTNVGRPYLELFGQTYPILKAMLPKLHMVLVCGPRLDPEKIQVPEGVDIRGYVPELFKHLAACDIAITTGGGGTTMELVALKKPFIFFPLEKHCEQTINVSKKLELAKAGTRMIASQTTPAQLAEVVMKELGRKVEYRVDGMDGTRGAADEILALMNKIKPAG